MLRKRVAIVVAAGTLGSLSLFSPAEATHSWANYHWARTANPFPLKVGDNVTGTWTGSLTTAVADWKTSPVLGLSQVAGTSNKRCSKVVGTVQVCNGTYGSNGWLGLASVNITGDHITRGTAKMNDTYFNAATYNNPNDKQHVMCQEIGHTFGLGHISEDGTSQNTCMGYFSNTGANASSTLSTHPNRHDYDQLGTIYTHLDTTTTVAAATTATNRSEVGNDRSTWGREIERGAHGQFSVFERDFGGGEKVITHVTWANDRQAGG